MTDGVLSKQAIQRLFNLHDRMEDMQRRTAAQARRKLHRNHLCARYAKRGAKPRRHHLSSAVRRSSAQVWMTPAQLRRLSISR